MFEPAFLRRKQLELSQSYMQRLLGDAPRKNTKRIAIKLGENVRNTQHYIGQSPWEVEPVIAIHQRLVGETHKSKLARIATLSANVSLKY
jgi:hypothetical protein